VNRLHLPVLNRHAPPATRAECIAGTPSTGSLEERRAGRAECSAYRCRHNLRRIDAENVPGRRNNGRDPEWTFDSEMIRHGGPSCALDIADAGAHRCSEIAAIEGKSKRRIQQEAKAAVIAWREACIDAGLPAEDVRLYIKDLLRMLDEERREA
jgi:hypothetical protein